MQDLVAEFLAKGGQIKKIESGRKSLGLSDREWRLQTQMTKAERFAGLETDTLASERRAELAAELGRTGDRIGACDALSGR